ncbi:MAG: RNA polymerase sigma factor [Cyclobacteriaceae bacterium]|nr:RNA polymerase sigma factor [Cyclobacteriaceae bacterium]
MYPDTLLDIAMIHAENLIEKARRGDDKAISQLISLWHKRLYNFCYKYFSDHDLAMEVTQKTFIAMYKNIETLADISKFKPWLYRIAVNHCHEEERKSKRNLMVSFRKGSDEEKEKVENIIDDSINPYQQLQLSELNGILKECFMLIAAEQREVLIMKEYEGLKFREIAEVLDISENTAKSRLYYGLNSLRKILKAKNINKDTVYYGN